MNVALVAHLVEYAGARTVARSRVPGAVRVCIGSAVNCGPFPLSIPMPGHYASGMRTRYGMWKWGGTNKISDPRTGVSWAGKRGTADAKSGRGSRMTFWELM